MKASKLIAAISSAALITSSVPAVYAEQTTELVADRFSFSFVSNNAECFDELAVKLSRHLNDRDFVQTVESIPPFDEGERPVGFSFNESGIYYKVTYTFSVRHFTKHKYEDAMNLCNSYSVNNHINVTCEAFNSSGKKADRFYEYPRYNELLGMTDDELIAEFPEFKDDILNNVFSDKNMTDIEKFKTISPQFASDLDINNVRENGYRVYISLIDKDAVSDVSPAELGLPDSWDISADLGDYMVYRDELYYFYMNMYDINIPYDEFDYSKYARLVISCFDKGEELDLFFHPLVGCEPYKVGDANFDNEVNMADAVLVMQCASNPDNYSIDHVGKRLADVDGTDGVTVGDAQVIQAYKLGLETFTPAPYLSKNGVQLNDGQ